MSQNKCSTSNDNAHHEAASKRADDSSSSSSYDPCDNKTRNTNEQSAILNPENVNATSARLSSSEEDMQETPIDFSLPKGRRKISPHRRQTFLQQTYYVSSSPPLNMSSQRSTPDNLHETEYNGARSPSNLYSQHANSNSNSELFANGHIVASRLSPEMIMRERSQSFSSLNQIRQRLSAAQHPHTLPSNSEVGPSSTHVSDPASSQNVTHPFSYAEIVPQSMAVCTSPNVTGISGLAPDEVINHYGFLPAGVESSFAETLGRNGLLTSSLHNKIPAGRVTPELSTTNSAKLIATIKTTSPSLTVNTSPSLTVNTSPSLTVTTSPSRAVTTSPSRALTTSPSLSVSASGVTKRRRSLPDDQKDRAYWERRRKNNVAAKRSRDARRIKEEAIALRASFLEQENLKLRCEIATLKAETEKLRVLLYDN